MKNRMFAIGVFVAMLAAPMFASAERGMGGEMDMGIGPGKGNIPLEMLIRDESVAEELKLTDQQRDKLAKLLMTSRKEDIHTMADLQVLRLEMEDLLNQDNPDVKKVDSKLDEMAKLQTKLAKSKIHLLLDGKKILTDEQVEKVKTMLRERKRRGGERNPKVERGGRGERSEMPGGGPGDEFGGGPEMPPPGEGMPPEFNSPFPSPEGTE